LSVYSSTLKVPRDVSRVAVGFAMAAHYNPIAGPRPPVRTRAHMTVADAVGGRVSGLASSPGWAEDEERCAGSAARMSTPSLHPLLVRQLESLGLDRETPPSPEGWQRLLDAVSERLAADERDAAIHAATLEASPDGVLIVGADRQIAGYNRRFLEVWGYPEEVLALRHGERFIQMTLERVADPVAFEERARWLQKHPDASVRGDVFALLDGRLIERDAAPVVTANGQYHGRVYYFRDITERRRAETREREMKETAERAARAKSDFLRNMSHEMRTPLNAILGFARVLRRSAELGAEQQAHLQDIVDAGGYMLQLVNDLLDLRSLEESRLELAPVALGPIIEQSAALVRPLVQEKHLELVLAIPQGLPSVLGDRRAIVQILVNLLSNGGKFTAPGGSLEVSARHTGGCVEIAVRDTGCGIAPEDQARLFVYFEQLGGKNAARMKGSGVGLALTRSLVEKQGGSITVESELGKGSTFRVRLGAAT
jgi:signal transduction histidine kinase